MLTIYKYDLIKHAGRIEIPYGAEILSIQLQNDKVFLWAKVDTEHYCVHRQFERYGTGWAIDHDAYTTENFIATIQDKDGFVWHWFEVI
jgi:hypothetical protein